MFGSLKIFEINLDNSSAIFRPGASITGQVVIDLSKSAKLRALTLRFKGRCKVSWSEIIGYASHVHTANYLEEEIYFCTDMCLDRSISLKKGYYIFPFSFSLPQNIPSSFEHSFGFVRYSIKAVIDRPWKFNHKTKMIFTVETPLKLKLSSLKHDIDEEYEKNYRCMLLPCINQGSITHRIQIPKTEYACNDIIEAKININNKSNSINITKIELALQQTLTFNTLVHKRTTHDFQVKQFSKQKGPFLKHTDVLLKLQIPSLPFSHLQYCNLLDIKYQILVKFYASGLHCPSMKKYDILIGSRPSIQSVTASPALSNPANEPMFSLDYSKDLIANSYPDSLLFNTQFEHCNSSTPANSTLEIPPPSYDSAIA